MAKKPKKTAKPKLNLRDRALADFVRAVMAKSGERDAGNRLLVQIGAEPVLKASDPAES